jgi:hypothetical protein
MLATMKAAEILSRINGISTPWGGVSWIPPVPDVQIARRVIGFVEVRRVLFSSYTDEVPDQCIKSVIEIRDFLTETLGQGSMGKELAQCLTLARRACVRFLQKVGRSEPSHGEGSGRRLFEERHWGMRDYRFGEALGELRSIVALQIGIVAGNFDLDLEDDLANMLP